MSQQDMDQLRAAIEDRLSWSPYESVNRARAEVVDVAADMLAEVLWLHAEAVWLARYEDEDDDTEARTLPELIALLRSRHELARRLYLDVAKDLKQAEASRRDWAAEAMRLEHEQRDIARAIETAAAVHPEADR